MISRSHQQRPWNPLNTQELPKLSPVPAPIGRGMAFGVRQSVDERDLKLDLLTPQRGRGDNVSIRESACVNCSAASTSAERASDLARYARAAVGHNRWRAWAPPKRALGHGSLIRATRIHLLPSLSLS